MGVRLAARGRGLRPGPAVAAAVLAAPRAGRAHRAGGSGARAARPVARDAAGRLPVRAGDHRDRRGAHRARPRGGARRGDGVARLGAHRGHRRGAPLAGFAIDHGAAWVGFRHRRRPRRAARRRRAGRRGPAPARAGLRPGAASGRRAHWSVRIELVAGDITTQAVDAVVNAANSSLLGGGGVDGAIHAAGGPQILAACRGLRATSLPDGLPTGQAVATTAGRLPARWVIHTVGPVYGRDPAAADLLASAYRESLRVADELGAASVAFPSISTGAYGYPLHEAAPIAVRTVRESGRAGGACAVRALRPGRLRRLRGRPRSRLTVCRLGRRSRVASACRGFYPSTSGVSPTGRDRRRSAQLTGPVSFSPGPCAGRVGHGGGLAEGQLHLAQPVAQQPRVLVAHLGRGRGHQTGERRDELAGLVEVAVSGALLVRTQAALHGGGAHQVQRGGGDHLDGRDVGDVAHRGGVGASARERVTE